MKLLIALFFIFSVNAQTLASDTPTPLTNISEYTELFQNADWHNEYGSNQWTKTIMTEDGAVEAILQKWFAIDVSSFPITKDSVVVVLRFNIGVYCENKHTLKLVTWVQNGEEGLLTHCDGSMSYVHIPKSSDSMFGTLPDGIMDVPPEFFE